MLFVRGNGEVLEDLNQDLLHYIEAGLSSTATVPLRHRWETAYLEALSTGRGDNALALSPSGPSSSGSCGNLWFGYRAVGHRICHFFLSLFGLVHFCYCYYDTPSVFGYAVASEV